jgi:hypothetical protein
MLAASSLDQQLAATWNAARTDRRPAPRRLVYRLVRSGR